MPATGRSYVVAFVSVFQKYVRPSAWTSCHGGGSPALLHVPCTIAATTRSEKDYFLIPLPTNLLRPTNEESAARDPRAAIGAREAPSTDALETFASRAMRRGRVGGAVLKATCGEVGRVAIACARAIGGVGELVARNKRRRLQRRERERPRRSPSVRSTFVS